MQARILRIGFGMVLLAIGYLVGAHRSNPVHAQSMQTSVPSYYGRLVAGDSSSLWFEDKDGTLRQVTIPAGSTVYTVNRPK